MATFSGLAAISLWSLLAVLTAASGAVPPFQLAAIAFGLASLVGIFGMWRKGVSLTVFRQPLSVWALGLFGLFGYHFFYFTALRNAPPVEAGLIAYLWPLLIVLMSALLPGERLRWFHLVGALMGLSGTALLIAKEGAVSFDSRYTTGYGAAVVCAFTWSGYSVLSRKFAAVPTDIVTGFCIVAALLSTLCHGWLEVTKWPGSATEWLAVLGLGLGPVGLAFYAWDIGVKRGNIQLLGVASYGAPLLSTLLLIAFGYGQFTWKTAAACLLIALGALLAAKGVAVRKA